MPVPQEQMMQHERTQHYQTRPVTPIYLPPQDHGPSDMSQRIPAMVQQPPQPLHPPMPYRHHYPSAPYFQGYQNPPQFGLERSPHNAMAPPPRPPEPVVLKPEQHYVGPNQQQQNFTVTLSFQANPDQQSMQLSRANFTRTRSQAPDVSGNSQAPYPPGPYPERYEADEKQPTQVRPMQIPPDPNYYAQHAVPDSNAYYPMQTPDQVLVPSPPAPQTPVYHTEPQLHSSPMSHQPFGQSHVYKPHYMQQVYRQTSQMSRNVAPIMMAPSPHPHQSMFVPVMPMQPFQPSPPQVVLFVNCILFLSCKQVLPLYCIYLWDMRLSFYRQGLHNAKTHYHWPNPFKCGVIGVIKHDRMFILQFERRGSRLREVLVKSCEVVQSLS